MWCFRSHCISSAVANPWGICKQDCISTVWLNQLASISKQVIVPYTFTLLLHLNSGYPLSPPGIHWGEIARRISHTLSAPLRSAPHNLPTTSVWHTHTHTHTHTPVPSCQSWTFSCWGSFLTNPFLPGLNYPFVLQSKQLLAHNLFVYWQLPCSSNERTRNCYVNNPRCHGYGTRKKTAKNGILSFGAMGHSP